MNLEAVKNRAAELFLIKVDQINVRTNHLFAWLIFLEWAAAIILAAVMTPLAWEGSTSYVHPHLWLSIVGGGAICLPAVYCAIHFPSAALTRHIIAACQMLFSALFIHLSGGRIETHFHVFGSLALMSFYRDWTVLVTASVVVLVHHLLGGILIPQSVYGVLTASPWRSLEHAAWVLFEDAFLIKTCLQNQAEMQADALRQSQIENTTNRISEIAEKRARELQKSEANYSAIVESTSDAILSTTLNGEIASWNPGAERMFGYAAEEAVGKTTTLLIPYGTNDESMMLAMVGSGASIEEFETLRNKRDGTIINVAVSMSPLRDSDGTIYGASMIARDITSRKEVEKRISEFHSTVSHELRTPLTSIRGALGLIDDEIIDLGSQEAREMIRIARTSSERLVRLINDILDLKKIESGKLELDKQKVSPLSLVSNSVELMEGMARASNVTVEHDVERNIIVDVDSDRITQVLTNLLSNAVKFSHSGQLIMVSVETTKDGNARFSVTDEGAGIPIELQYKLFGKFQQIDSSDTRPKEGTGLGLAISKAIVEEHGGTIGVHSRPNIGTTFWFELPCIKETVDMPEENLELDSKRQTVLLVEDDLNLSRFLKLRLTKEGYRVFAGETCRHSLAIAERITPDVVIVDVMLPDGSGLELIEKFRQQTQLLDIPMIVMTGKELDANKCGLPVVFDWFYKPFEYSQLIKSVQRATSESSRTVLVVEDERDTRAVIVAQLKKIGAVCLEAENGVEAISLAESNRPDVIILDVNIPQRDGFEVVESLSMHNLSATPLVVYSAEDLSEPQRKRLTLGLTRHMTKGRVSPEEFVKAVSDLLDTVTKRSKSGVSGNLITNPVSSCVSDKNESVHI